MYYSQIYFCTCHNRFNQNDRHNQLPLKSAPISKVIEYLPSNIPRILINRAIVHPSTTSGDNADDDNTDENDREFRTKYVFDAYLLGFCDDVTRALAKQLFKKQRQPLKVGSSGSGSGSGGVGKDAPRSTTGSGGSGGGNSSNESQGRQQQQQPPDCGGTLLTTVLRDGNDEYFDVKDWSDAVVPAERVLLFPGALPPSTKEDKNSNDSGGGGAVGTTELTYCEIAHCDGCSKRIFGVIRKCVICFDYDLCSKCYPKLHMTHYDGKHVFNSEPAAAF
jgi:hypothetical protein